MGAKFKTIFQPYGFPGHIIIINKLRQVACNLTKMQWLPLAPSYTVKYIFCTLNSNQSTLYACDWKGFTHPKESTIFARATEMCILVLFDTARASSSCGASEAVAAATTNSLRTPVR